MTDECEICKKDISNRPKNSKYCPSCGNAPATMIKHLEQQRILNSINKDELKNRIWRSVIDTFKSIKNDHHNVDIDSFWLNSWSKRFAGNTANVVENYLEQIISGDNND